MPASWKFSMVIIVVCLAASLAIGSYRLATTTDYVFEAPDNGWQGVELPR